VLSQAIYDKKFIYSGVNEMGTNHEIIRLKVLTLLMVFLIRTVGLTHNIYYQLPSKESNFDFGGKADE